VGDGRRHDGPALACTAANRISARTGTHSAKRRQLGLQRRYRVSGFRRQALHRRYFRRTRDVPDRNAGSAARLTLRRHRSMDSFDPKIGLLWTPRDDLYVRASAGTSFASPARSRCSASARRRHHRSDRGDTINARGLLVGTATSARKPPTTGPRRHLDITDAFTAELNYWSVTSRTDHGQTARPSCCWTVPMVSSPTAISCATVRRTRCVKSPAAGRAN